jgi:hypothetical protein
MSFEFGIASDNAIVHRDRENDIDVKPRAAHSPRATIPIIGAVFWVRFDENQLL